MQKSRKITSKSSSIRTVPVMRPSARNANRRSSAASAISGAESALPSEHPPANGQHRAERELGNSRRSGAECVADDDSTVGAGFQVDAIEARALTRDHP